MPDGTLTGAPKRRIGLILLAAGGSTRMGRAKQLLALDGTPLVVRAVQAALAAPVWPIVVVVGRDAGIIRGLLTRWPLLIEENASWERGIGTSIRAGIEALHRFSDTLDGCALCVCDQPGLTSDVISRLANALIDGNGIAAARYAGTTGSPVVFGRAWFSALRTLPDEAGAQRLLRESPHRVIAIDFPELAIDLDTPEQYAAYTRTHKPNTPA